jgi:glycosyltransferase involved in cell wall biosynthesis
VVATRLAGDRDASGGVIDGYNGFLVEPGNVDQMAEKIIVLLKNDAMREKMGRKSREIVQTFDWSEVGKKYVRLYGDVCNK